jgi:hydroxyethylthiazole kinase-like uncharacterized protein yjeF
MSDVVEVQSVADMLLTPAEMQAVDAAAIASGASSMLLMERAGKAVAEHAASLLQSHGVSRSSDILILCGPGNNGGDGYVAARLLASEGYVVRIVQTAPIADSSSDAATAALAWPGGVTALNGTDEPGGIEALLGKPALVIDAIYGAGLSRDVDGRVAHLIEAVSDLDALKLAVDMPSGLDGESGQVRGTAMQVDATVTFHLLKSGHVLLPGRELCGIVHLADIGIPSSAMALIDPALRRNTPALFSNAATMPKSDAHKFSRGLAIGLSGGPWQTGAIRLAATAALRAGAGIVKIVSPKAALPIHAAHLTSVMLIEAGTAKEISDVLSDKRITAVLFGPGGGTDRYAKSRLSEILRVSGPIVLDADAITMLAADPGKGCAQLKARRGPTIITPHEGEFERLFPDLAMQPSRRDASASSRGKASAASKVERARLAADRTGSIVVFKGPDTVIAAPGGQAAINDHTSPNLATAGSGDVLAGIITGLLASGSAPFDAACAGVWLHGEAGLSRGRGTIAEDLVCAIPHALDALDQWRMANPEFPEMGQRV